jgi:hypothetical protein
MKRERNSVFLVPFFLFLFSVPMTAQESPRASFELTTPLVQTLEVQEQMPPLGDLWIIPAPSWKTCQADITCSSGCKISCTGPNETACSSNATSVTCSGTTVNCPYPTCTPLSPCVDPCNYCACRANGGGGFFCYTSWCEA